VQDAQAEGCKHGRRRTSREPPPPKQEPYPEDKARGGEIILDTPLKRGILIAGLVGAIVLVLILAFLR
jgi:hypothetical protein